MGLKTRHYRPPAGFLPGSTAGEIDESVWARVVPLFSYVLIFKNLVFLQVFCYQHLTPTADLTSVDSKWVRGERKDWTNEGLPKVRKFTCREVYQSITENQRKI